MSSCLHLTTRFAINEWVEYAIADMQPVVWYMGREMSATEAFDEIMDTIDGGGEYDAHDPSRIAYTMSVRSAIFGHNCVISASEEYYELSTQRELGYTIAEWESLTRYDRGRLIAHFKLHNMIETINQYIRHLENEKKK